ncbi:MAG TPA: S41 family peptidase [Saprospiraceae bacterium]|nr:S41 family peptidase [Saprospiraceae bacterium]
MHSETPRPGNGRIFIWLPFLLSAVLAVGILTGMRLQSAAPPLVINGEPGADPSAPAGYGKLEELLRYVEAKYVDPVDREKLVDEAIESILQQLDPHSSYIPSDQVEIVEEHMEGSFSGIGVEFLMMEDTLTVIAPLGGGPAEKAGIMAGDKIIGVGDSIIAGKKLVNKDITSLLRGEIGTKVQLLIKRGSGKPFKVSVVRDKIPMHSMDAALMLTEKTGYIRLNRFSATTHNEFMKALEKLHTKQGLEHLVIDLRQNPGGYLQQAINILSQLFPAKGVPLVHTQGRAVSRSDYETAGRVLFPVKEIVVLIDEGSASASEILAGALQDQDRAAIVGRRSFGKGLVQEQYELRDGSALRLTVARYYTPSGRSIQKPYDNLSDYDHETEDRLESGELTAATAALPEDSVKYYTSKGRVVFGGGGITPDYYVPLDTALLNDYYLRLRPHLQSFVFNYSQKNKTQFEGLKLKEFKNTFTVKDQIINDFIAYTAGKGVAKEAQQLPLIMPELRRQLKAQLARTLFQDEGFFAIMTAEDPMVKKALSVIEGKQAQR